ncbi:MAG TPA: hypothetical protein VFT50_01210 [Baekduia sp.]|nr:hypothetical protein [Baekduia sp.]
MLCAHTVRKLKPGTFDQFAEAFRPDQGSAAGPPSGWVRFDLCRGVSDPDEVVTFGFFDGTMEQLEANQDDHGYADRVAAVAPFVDHVEANGVYEVVVELKAEGTAA